MNTKERNDELIKLFQGSGVSDVRLLGNPTIPAIIIFNKIVVSCHVSGSMLYFTDIPKNGHVVLEVDLSKDYLSKISEVVKVVNSIVNRRCYRIESLSNKNSLEIEYLSDYRKDPDTGVKQPVFSRLADEAKLYFEFIQAEEALAKIRTRNPNLILKIV